MVQEVKRRILINVLKHNNIDDLILSIGSKLPKISPMEEEVGGKL
jgi:hypothetical protein